jgi:hypothetical protein
MSRTTLSELDIEALKKATRLINEPPEPEHIVRTNFGEFQLMDSGNAVYIFSNKLCRAVFFYHKAKKTVTVPRCAKAAMSNREELQRIVKIMRGMMILEDLADV